FASERRRWKVKLLPQYYPNRVPVGGRRVRFRSTGNTLTTSAGRTSARSTCPHLQTRRRSIIVPSFRLLVVAIRLPHFGQLFIYYACVGCGEADGDWQRFPVRSFRLSAPFRWLPRPLPALLPPPARVSARVREPPPLA